MKDKSSAKGFYLSSLKNLFLNCASGGNGICQNWCISGIPKNVNKGADDVFTSNKYDYVQGVQYMLNFMTEFKTEDDSLMFMHTGSYLLHNNGWNILCLGEPL